MSPTPLASWWETSLLIALMVSLVFLLGMVGLAVDIGRMYVTKGEAQSFVDSAALAAATKLDGTSSGLDSQLRLSTAAPLPYYH
jgi:uncharacterized membrane protein